MTERLIWEQIQKKYPDQESNVRNIRVVDKDGRLHVLCDRLGDSI